jgi:Protein of unknown function (DUF5672)
MNKKLPNVTLVAVDCTDRINGTIQALVEGSEHLDFGAVKLLSNKRPENLPEFIQYEEIMNITNINEYNYFMFIELGSYIQTTHCLTIQDHARVINESLWNDDWLEFDYIGSPWGIVENAYIGNNGERARVGNGGFSLRSLQLTQIPKRNHWSLRQEQQYFNEDGNICCYYRAEFLKAGIKYAPVEVAAKFAFENVVPENHYVKPFGYHRNLPPWDYKA